jgi:LPS-assembly protein
VADSVVINLNDYAIARNMVLRVKGVPLFYLPIVYYPIQDDERATGFLMPTYGTSTLRGGQWSNAFFWAINRSQDATLFHDWYTRIGQGMGAEYRYVSGPMSSGNVRLYRLAQRETQFEQSGSSQVLPAETSYLVNANVNQQLGQLRAQGRVEYFTEVKTGQLYFRDPYQQTQSRRIVDAGVSGNFGPTSMGAYYSRSEVFTDSSHSSVSGSLPRATINVAPQRLLGSPVYTSLNADYAFLPNQRIRDGEVVSDESLGRLDVAPSIRAPLSRLTYLSAVVTAAYRSTYYSRSLDSEQRLGDEPVTRQFVSLQSQFVGPVLTKIWDTPGSTFSARMKHVIEPTFATEWVSDITNQARLPVVESTGTAVGGAVKLTYGITNRVLARKPDEGATRGATREFLTIGVQQTFYSNPETSRYDSTYVSYALRPRPVDLSPVALTVRVAPVDGIDANARVEYDVTGNGFQVLTAGSTMTAGPRSASLSFSRQRATPLSPVSSYLSGSTALRFREGRVATFYSVSWDIDTRFIQSQSVGATYFAQCCGLQVDFQNVNFPRTGGFPIPSDRRFNFAFILAGLGTFSNFFGAFGGQP